MSSEVGITQAFFFCSPIHINKYGGVMERNRVVLVDILDRERGVCPKEEAHRLCRLHRAFSVFLVNGNRVLIQKRAKNKYHSAGLWANACCSHPQAGESVVVSAEKRLLEELGITTKLKPVHQFVYKHKFSEELYEYEYDHVLLGHWKGKTILNKEEASKVRWVNKDKLLQAVKKYPHKFAPWFVLCAPKVLASL